MKQEKLEEIKARLAIIYTSEEYEKWTVQQIAELRMDAKRLLKALEESTK